MDVINTKNDFKYVVAIGASTGGKDTICRILNDLPENFSPVLIVQHMPPEFTASYVRHMRKNTGREVVEAKDGDELKRGIILVAPGEHQMRIVNKNERYFVSCREEGAYKGNCPSIDILFNSVAEVMKDKGIGIILTGAGCDGTAGLLEMKKQGSFTIGQDEESSLVYNMPKLAYEQGGVSKQVGIDNISNEVSYFIKRNEFTNEKKYFYFDLEVEEDKAAIV